MRSLVAVSGHISRRYSSKLSVGCSRKSGSTPTPRRPTWRAWLLPWAQGRTSRRWFRPRARLEFTRGGCVRPNGYQLRGAVGLSPFPDRLSEIEYCL